MAQVTIYLDAQTESKLKQAAKSSQLSVSKWIAKAIEEKVATQWSDEVIELAGSWKNDDSLVKPHPPLESDVPRQLL